MILNGKWNQYKWVHLIFLLLLLHVPTAFAYNQVINYSFNMSQHSNGMGGNLTHITPYRFIPLNPEMKFGMGFLSVSDYSDYYRQGSLELGDASFARTTNNLLYVRKGGKIPGEISFISKYSMSRIRGVDNTHLSLDNTCEAYGGSLKLQYGPVLVSSYYLSDNEDQKEGSVSAAMTYKENYLAGISWRKKLKNSFLYGLREEYQGYWEESDDPIYANLRFRENRETLSAYFEVSPHPWIKLNGIGNRHLWINQYSIYEDLDLYPTIYPWGDETDYHTFISLGSKPILTSIGIRQKQYDLMAYGYKGVGTFSKISEFVLENYGEFVSISLSPEETGITFLVEAEKSKLDAEISGYLEFWPWSSGWADLFGYRRYGQGTLEADYWRYHLALSKTYENRTTLSCGLNFIDIYPDIKWSDYTWGFWVHRADIDYYRLQVGMISLGLKKAFQHFSFEYEFNQVVPIEVWEEDLGTSEPGSDPYNADKVLKSNEYGGGLHRLTLSYSF